MPALRSGRQLVAAVRLLLVATVVLGALIVEISRLYHQLAGSHAELAARADALSEANGELRRADQFKADLVGMLSHEVSQPLQSILGYTETTVDERGGGLAITYKKNP